MDLALKEIIKICKYIGSTTMDQIPEDSLFPPKNAFLAGYKIHFFLSVRHTELRKRQLKNGKKSFHALYWALPPTPHPLGW